MTDSEDPTRRTSHGPGHVLVPSSLLRFPGAAGAGPGSGKLTFATITFVDTDAAGTSAIGA